MAFGSSEEQALAMFTASGEALRWLVSQKWQVTYFALTAYVALTAAPRLICQNAVNGVCVLVNCGCGILAAVIAFVAWGHLYNLHWDHKVRLAEVHVAAKELTGVLQIRAAAKELTGVTPIQEPGEPGLIIAVLVAAVVIGAGLVTVINFSHALTVATIWVGAFVLGLALVGTLLPVL